MNAAGFDFSPSLAGSSSAASWSGQAIFAPSCPASCSYCTPPERTARIRATRGGWRLQVLEDERQTHANIWREIFKRTFPRLVDAIRHAESFEPKTTSIEEKFCRVYGRTKEEGCY